MGSKSKMSRGKRGKMSKQMHHSPGGKVKGKKADKHPTGLDMKHQDPMV